MLINQVKARPNKWTLIESELSFRKNPNAAGHLGVWGTQGVYVRLLRKFGIVCYPRNSCVAKTLAGVQLSGCFVAIQRNLNLIVRPQITADNRDVHIQKSKNRLILIFLIMYRDHIFP